MTSDQRNAAPRLEMKPPGSARGRLDGGWWPASDDLAAELPVLVTALAGRVGPVSRVSYHLDTWRQAGRKAVVDGTSVRLEGFRSMSRNTIVVIGVDHRRITLLVVPQGTPGGPARAALRSAAGPESTADADEILAGNGVPR